MGLRGPGANPAPIRRAKAEAPSSQHDMFGTVEVLAPKPFEPWREPGLTRAERVIAFVETLPITQGSLAGTTMHLRGWQRRFVEEVYAEDDRGGRPVRTAVLSMARKNGKTQLAAALCLAHLAGPEAESRGQCFSAAADRDQAALLFREMLALIEADEEWADPTLWRAMRSASWRCGTSRVRMPPRAWPLCRSWASALSC